MTNILMPEPSGNLCSEVPAWTSTAVFKSELYAGVYLERRSRCRTTSAFALLIAGLVTHQPVLYTTKWWTQGEIPGADADRPWTDHLKGERSGSETN